MATYLQSLTCVHDKVGLSRSVPRIKGGCYCDAWLVCLFNCLDGDDWQLSGMEKTIGRRYGGLLSPEVTKGH